ncbi:MAG: outer-membrane lipoprotein lolB [bacterium]|nr:MAG: outer-membrane lipoprotein lolB [bacterium]KAF0148423.1 MAG: outer-membrane lipoprotein lolB [bacterium]KAF0167967.1 MAG: outer-membrane lipoprotein lolB [bacterium]TXT21290.1 MAG: outer-membrane lipoprotein lolB [bacterium]
MSSRGRGLVVALTALLAGCAQLPGFSDEAPAPRLQLAPPPAAYRLEGRVSVRAGEENFSGGIAWRRDAASEELLLSTPLGQGVAELRGDARGVTLLDAKGREHRASDAETLVRERLGMALPLRGLTWWVVGHPRPDSPYQAEADADGRIASLVQDQWRIEFSRYQAHGMHALPGKLVARRGDDLEVRLVVDQWGLP